MTAEEYKQYKERKRLRLVDVYLCIQESAVDRHTKEMAKQALEELIDDARVGKIVRKELEETQGAVVLFTIERDTGKSIEYDAYEVFNDMDELMRFGK